MVRVSSPVLEQEQRPSKHHSVMYMHCAICVSLINRRRCMHGNRMVKRFELLCNLGPSSVTACTGPAYFPICMSVFM